MHTCTQTLIVHMDTANMNIDTWTHSIEADVLLRVGEGKGGAAGGHLSDSGATQCLLSGQVDKSSPQAQLGVMLQDISSSAKAAYRPDSTACIPGSVNVGGCRGKGGGSSIPVIPHTQKGLPPSWCPPRKHLRIG